MFNGDGRGCYHDYFMTFLTWICKEESDLAVDITTDISSGSYARHGAHCYSPRIRSRWGNDWNPTETCDHDTMDHRYGYKNNKMVIINDYSMYFFYLRSENCPLAYYGQLKMVTRWILFRTPSYSRCQGFENKIHLVTIFYWP